MNNYTVIGSINIDLIARVKNFPKPGQTIIGEKFVKSFGGKGANQAVALARLGASVNMIGSVGDDIFGEEYLSEFQNNNINIKGIKKEKESTGIAMIEVDESGNNHIIVIPGANYEIDNKYIDSTNEIINTSSVALLQLEIKIETTLYALKYAKSQNIITILDPAPAIELENEFYKYTDFITPNETETEILTGVIPKDIDSIRKASDILIKKGATNIIIKCGNKGAYYINKNEIYFMPSYKVNTVDTTAAGDSFNAGFAYGVCEYKDYKYALKFACAVAALSTCGYGAQMSMPNLKEVEKLIEDNKNIDVISL